MTCILSTKTSQPKRLIAYRKEGARSPAHDPQMRHGRKSKSNRFDGHKAALAVDTDSQLVTAVGILSGNASDNTGALGLVERSEENTGIEVEETIGDAAYGDGATRQAFADAGRTLIAKVPARPEKAHFPKEDFHIDLEAATCTCPAGQKTQSLRVLNHRRNSPSRLEASMGFCVRWQGVPRLQPPFPMYCQQERQGPHS